MDPQPATPHAQPQDEELFSAFHHYPWQTDLVFLKGLIALLGGVQKLQPDPAQADMTAHARIFYYRRVCDVQVDFAAYKQWAAAARAGADSPARHRPDQDVLSALYWARDRLADLQGPPPPNPVHAIAAIAQQYVPADSAAAPLEAASGPAWQRAAPRLELRLTRESPSGPAGGGEGAAAPYPAHFAELIAAVRDNKPVPGIREIPDTVVRDPSVKPVGKMSAPKKPWEVKDSETGQHDRGFLADSGVEPDFPPLDDQPSET